MADNTFESRIPCCKRLHPNPGFREMSYQNGVQQISPDGACWRNFTTAEITARDHPRDCHAKQYCNKKRSASPMRPINEPVSPCASNDVAAKMKECLDAEKLWSSVENRAWICPSRVNAGLNPNPPKPRDLTEKNKAIELMPHHVRDDEDLQPTPSCPPPCQIKKEMHGAGGRGGFVRYQRIDSHKL